MKRAARVGPSAHELRCICAVWLSLGGLAASSGASCATGASDDANVSVFFDAGTSSSPDAGTSIPTDPTMASDGGATMTAPSDDAGYSAQDTGVQTGGHPDAGSPGGFDAGQQTLHDAGAPPSNDSSVSVACGGIPAWFSGTTATKVENGGDVYECIQTGWCDVTGVAAVDAWEPGTGSDWQEAWMLVGPCAGGGDD